MTADYIIICKDEDGLVVREISNDPDSEMVDCFGECPVTYEGQHTSDSDALDTASKYFNNQYDVLRIYRKIPI